MTVPAPRERANCTKVKSAEKKKAAMRPFLESGNAGRSALTRLETRIALADHEHLAATTYDLAVAMALLCGLEGRQHFHGTPRNGFWDTGNRKL
jgi:hypothetical protein